MKTFEELECWKKAATLKRNLSALTKSFPAEEKFKLTDQIIRASRSVTANIAEGYGRFHYKEYIQFCHQGRASQYGLLDHLLVAFEEKYISERQLKQLKSDLLECIALLNGFINYLIKAKDQSGVREPEIEYISTFNN